MSGIDENRVIGIDLHRFINLTISWMKQFGFCLKTWSGLLDIWSIENRHKANRTYSCHQNVII